MCEIHIQFWSENLKGRAHSEHLGVDGRIILKWILKKWVPRMWTGSMWLRIGANEHSYEPSGSING